MGNDKRDPEDLSWFSLIVGVILMALVVSVWMPTVDAWSEIHQTDTGK